MYESGSHESVAQPSFRRRLYLLLEPTAEQPRRFLRSGRINPPFVVEIGLVLVILVNSASLILWTVPSYVETFEPIFHLIEFCTVGIFLVEYALRFWTAPEVPHDSTISDWSLRRRHLYSLNALVDALALAPSAAAVVILLANGAGPSLSFLLTVRLLTRTAKLARYFPAARRLGWAIRRKGSQLITTVAGLMVALIIAAALMYFAETRAQPEVFSSIPAAMWWSVVTLTTVGYGDTIPVTTPGRALAAVIAVLGIGLFALPAGILSAGLLEADATDGRMTSHISGEVPDDGICPLCGQAIELRRDEAEQDRP